MSESKICIITTRNIFDSPCLEKYKSLINLPYDIIYWDRCGIIEECGANEYYKFSDILSPTDSRLKKIKAYIKFAMYANKILSKKSYKRLIIYPTQAAWIISYQLLKKYKEKYLLDIRDYAGEKKFLLGKFTSILVQNSGLTSITSPEYREFLPQYNYIISHNIQLIDKHIVNDYRHKKRKKEKYTLSFIGSVRFIDQQKKLIKRLANDNRFLLRYIGRGSEQLVEFCKTENISNVEFIGQFKREELSSFYLETDMAINVYGNNDPYLDYALSNKLYSAAIMGMPILVSSGTYMEKISKKYGFGIAYDFYNPNINDILFKYLDNISFTQLFYGCDNFMRVVSKQEEEYAKIVTKFLNKSGF